MVAGQALQFFLAGFETVSAILSFSLYELCIQPDIQDKLRTEILENIKQYNGITYEGLSEMKYLDMCVAGMKTLSWQIRKSSFYFQNVFSLTRFI